MKLNKLIVFGLILSLLSISVIAQDKDKEPLTNILYSLEILYEVSFTYLDEDIEGVYINAPTKNYTMEEAIRYLEINTGLEFRILDNRFITISKQPEKLVDICGILIDNKDGIVINGATIQADRKFTVSDEYGRFNLNDVKEEDTILVRFLGYEYLFKPVNGFSDGSCDTLWIRQQIQRLREIVITNFITQGIDKDADGTYLIRTKSTGFNGLMLMK